MHYLPYIPLYFFTFVGLVLIIRSFVQIFKPGKKLPAKKTSLDLDAEENYKLYLSIKI